MILLSSIMGLICGALSYWFNAYNDKYVGEVNIYYLMSGLVFISIITIGFIYKNFVFRAPIYFCLGFMASVLARIFYDTSIDPSAHNLLPFEIIFILLIIVPSSFAGSVFVRLINKKTTDKDR